MAPAGTTSLQKVSKGIQKSPTCLQMNKKKQGTQKPLAWVCMCVCGGGGGGGGGWVAVVGGASFACLGPDGGHLLDGMVTAVTESIMLP